MFKHLLVLLDGSEFAECVLPHAIAFARAFEAQITLLRVSAHTSLGTMVDLFDWQMAKAEAQAYVDRIATHLRTTGVAAETVVLTGEPVICITHYVYTHPLDLIILSNHGESGLTSWRIGSIAQKILVGSSISALLVRAEQAFQAKQTDLHYRRLLVPLDGSPRAEHVLPFAETLARFSQAQLLLIHVLCPPEIPHRKPFVPTELALIDQLITCNRAVVTQRFAQLNAGLPAATESRLLERADVAAGLHEVAEEAIDLMILSAHGYSGSSQWAYGSITTNFIANRMTPLLIIQDGITDCRSSRMEDLTDQYGRHMYRTSERLAATSFNSKQEAYHV